MKYCYTDFAFTILDYFSVINSREFYFEWIFIDDQFNKMDRALKI